MDGEHGRHGISFEALKTQIRSFVGVKSSQSAPRQAAPSRTFGGVQALTLETPEGRGKVQQEGKTGFTTYKNKYGPLLGVQFHGAFVDAMFLQAAVWMCEVWVTRLRDLHVSPKNGMAKLGTQARLAASDFHDDT